MMQQICGHLPKEASEERAAGEQMKDGTARHRLCAMHERCVDFFMEERCPTAIAASMSIPITEVFNAIRVEMYSLYGAYGDKDARCAELGRRGGMQTAKRGAEYFRQIAAMRKTNGGGRPRKVKEVG